MNFAGFDDWIPVFRGGKQRDSSGKEHDGDALIDKALSKFNASVHEPPAVIGHPETNAPAYGWVEGLKEGNDKLGRLLLAKFKQVQPEFAQMVKSGLFKKRSAAFYPDGTLRHVGFLGAMPPAVKSLPDVAFADGDPACFEFSDSYAWNSLADIFRRFREWLIETKDQDTADRVIPDWKIEELRSAGQETPAEEIQPATSLYQETEDDMNFKQKMSTFFKDMLDKMPDDGPAVTATGQFSETDLEKARQEGAAAEREKITLEFSEKAKKTREDGLRKEIDSFCERMVSQGRITGATVKFGLPDILFACARQEEQIEFGENKEKATPYDRLKAMIESAQPLIKFGEVATRDKDTGGGSGTAGEKLDQLTRARMREDKLLTYATAFAEVQHENPDLAREYQAEFQGE